MVCQAVQTKFCEQTVHPIENRRKGEREWNVSLKYTAALALPVSAAVKVSCCVYVYSFVLLQLCCSVWECACVFQEESGKGSANRNWGAYHSFLNREGPRALGSKEIPTVSGNESQHAAFI